MAKQILIKPILSEKSERLSDRLNQYSFIVDKSANKIQIKNAVEEMYSVTVDRVNTTILPAKKKVRNTKSGIVTGYIPAYKKAIVTLPDGEEIDFFGDI